MKKNIELIKEKKWIHYLIILIIGLLIGIPFLWLQLRETHDGWLHLIRVVGLDLSLSQGEYPFLVAPFICRNFGYSMAAFYPPIVTYIPYIIGLITNSFNIGLKIFAALTVAFSGITMYNLTNEVTKNKRISFLAAIIYMIFPYRLEMIYTRFAIGEFTALVFIPMVFEGLYNLLNGDKKKHFYIAIGAIGLILSHTISTLFTAIFCAIYILINIKKFIKKDVIIKCIVNVVFILLISAFFLVPLYEFESQAHYSIFEPSVMKTNGNYTSSRTIELYQFLKDKGEIDGVSFVVGIPTLIMLCITILMYQDIDKKYKPFYITCLAFGIFSIFMCTKYFPWYYMPQIIDNIQYPWRMIGFAMFFTAPVFAMNIYYLLNNIKKEKIKDILYVLVIIILGIFTIVRLSIYQEKDKSADKKSEATLRENPVISHLSVNRDYLPLKALVKQKTYLLYREDRVYVLKGDATIESETKQGLNLKFNISNANEDTVLELPYIFYPGYTVKLEYTTTNNSGNITITNLNTKESNSGFVEVTLPDDINKGTITVEYTGTTLETISYAISVISLVIFIIYIIYYKKKNKTEVKD